MCAINLTGENEITVQSGALLSKTAAFAMENSLTGFEFAHGIPGTIGGAVYMNAGAYGGEIKNVAVLTKAWGKNGIYTVRGDEHDFSYRHSCFSGKSDVILETVLRLAPGNREEIKREMSSLAAKRRASQPLDKPSAGSTFKRPAVGYAAALIDQAGLKGYTVGGAQVSEKHAGFVVNFADATYEDVIAVMDHVKRTVLEKCGVELEPEVEIWN
jgi:UDP-N-acetylmuramate dehydrogenase